MLRVPIQNRFGKILLDYNLFLPKNLSGQRIIIRIENEIVYQKRITQRGANTLELSLTNLKEVEKGFIELEFEFPDAESPKEAGLSKDIRKLAFGLKSIRFES